MSQTDDFIVITCKCGQKMKVPVKAEGKTYKCVKCAEPVHVPKREAPAARKNPPAPPPAANGYSQAVASEMLATEGTGDKRIGEILVEAGLVTQLQVDEALKMQETKGGKTLENLIALEHLDKQVLHDFLSQQPGTAVIELSRLRLDTALLQMVPKEIALDRLVLPIDRLGKLLTIAMACPLDKKTIMEIEQLTGLKVKAMLCKLDDLHAAVEKYYREADTGYDFSHILKMADASSRKAEKESDGDTLTEEEPAVSSKKDAPESSVAASSAPVSPAPPTPAPAPAPTPAPAAPPRDRLDVARELQRLDLLPVSAKVFKALEKALGFKDEVDEELIWLIEEDPGMALLALRLANSPIFGLDGQVDSISMAVILMGIEGLQLLIASSPEQLSDTEGESWVVERCRKCAVTAERLAQMSGISMVGVARTAGIIHLLGILGLQKVAGEYYQQIDSSLYNRALASAEEQVFTLPYTEAGRLLAAKWNLPRTLQQAIQYSATPERAGDLRPLASVVHVAAAIAAVGSATDAVEESCSESIKYLELDRTSLASL